MKVAATGSLSAAGRAHGPVADDGDQAHRRARARLGVKLFHRSTRRLSITEAGRNYLEASERILADMTPPKPPSPPIVSSRAALLRLNVPVSIRRRGRSRLCSRSLRGAIRW